MYIHTCMMFGIGNTTCVAPMGLFHPALFVPLDVAASERKVYSDPEEVQRTATHYNTLQHTATLWNTLQHTAMHCNTLQSTATHCNALQHTATHCSTLQHTATHCNAAQCSTHTYADVFSTLLLIHTFSVCPHCIVYYIINCILIWLSLVWIHMILLRVIMCYYYGVATIRNRERMCVCVSVCVCVKKKERAE